MSSSTGLPPTKTFDFSNLGTTVYNFDELFAAAKKFQDANIVTVEHVAAIDDAGVCVVRTESTLLLNQPEGKSSNILCYTDGGDSATLATNYRIIKNQASEGIPYVTVRNSNRVPINTLQEQTFIAMTNDIANALARENKNQLALGVQVPLPEPKCAAMRVSYRDASTHVTASKYMTNEGTIANLTDHVQGCSKYLHLYMASKRFGQRQACHNLVYRVSSKMLEVANQRSHLNSLYFYKMVFGGATPDRSGLSVHCEQMHRALKSLNHGDCGGHYVNGQYDFGHGGFNVYNNWPRQYRPKEDDIVLYRIVRSTDVRNQVTGLMHFLYDGFNNLKDRPFELQICPKSALVGFKLKKFRTDYKGININVLSKYCTKDVKATTGFDLEQAQDYINEERNLHCWQQCGHAKRATTVALASCAITRDSYGGNEDDGFGDDPDESEQAHNERTKRARDDTNQPDDPAKRQQI